VELVFLRLNSTGSQAEFFEECRDFSLGSAQPFQCLLALAFVLDVESLPEQALVDLEQPVYGFDIFGEPFFYYAFGHVLYGADFDRSIKRHRAVVDLL